MVRQAVTLVSGDRNAVVRHVRGLSTRARRGIPLLEAIDADWRIELAKRFDAEGPGWAPLAPSTLATKPAGLPILYRKGEMRRRATTDPKGRKITSLHLNSGTMPHYAKYHQSGTRNKNGTQRMPARKWRTITAADRRRWRRLAILHLTGKLVKPF